LKMTGRSEKKGIDGMTSQTISMRNCLVILTISLLVFSFSSDLVISDIGKEVHFFYGNGCPHCYQESVFLDSLSERYPELSVVKYEVYYNSSNAEIFSEFRELYDTPYSSVPMLFVKNEYIVGFANNETTGVEIENLINEEFFGIEYGVESSILSLPFIGKLDTSEMSLLMITVLIGLLDGFNPCAMFVLCFLLVFLIGTGSRKKVLIIGGVFLMISAVIYFLFISTWFNFFAIFKYVPILKWIVAVMVVFAGLVNIKDYFYFQKGLSFTLPKQWKSRIMKQMKDVSEKDSLLAMVAGVVAVALVVNVVELMCTIGFPMIYTQILSTYKLTRMAYYSYISLYCLFYMMDDLVLFLIAVATLRCMEMTKKRVRQMKLVSGMLMIALAIWFLLS